MARVTTRKLSKKLRQAANPVTDANGYMPYPQWRVKK